MAERPILVTSYPAPDMDGFGGAWAYAEFLTQTDRPAEARFFEEPRGEEQYVLELFRATAPELITNDHAYDQVVLVDASELSPFGNRLTATKVSEIIDHRELHEADRFPNAACDIQLVGAAATLVAERWAATDHSPTPISAALLMAGILSNTLNFQAVVATARDRQMYDWLRQFAKVPDDFPTALVQRNTEYVVSHLFSVVPAETAVWQYGRIGRVCITQLQLGNVDAFLATYRPQLMAAYRQALTLRNGDHGLIVLIDLTRGTTTFITDNSDLQRGLAATVKVVFHRDQASIPQTRMRKEFGPKLKAYLEHRS